MATDYHSQIGYPEIEFPTGSFDVEATRHARRESNKDRYGGFNLPKRVTLTEAMYERKPDAATGSQAGEKTTPHIFEITVENGEVVKIGARTHYDEKRDIVLIIMPNENLLKTAWINVKGDSHNTLDKSQYCKP